MGGVLRDGVFPAVWLLLAALLPGALRADVIYTNFGDGDSYLGGSGLIVTRDGAAWSSVAVSFVPAAAYSLSSIEFAASSLIAGGAGTSVAIFADDDGHPAGRSLETITLDGKLTPFGGASALLTVQSSLHPLLEAGETYWVGMNAPRGGLAVWNQTTSLSTGFAATDGAGKWSFSNGVQGAMELEGTPVWETPPPVPDPSPVPDPPPPSPRPGSFPLLLAAAQAPQEVPTVTPEPDAFCLAACGLATAMLLTRRLRR